MFVREVLALAAENIARDDLSAEIAALAAGGAADGQSAAQSAPSEGVLSLLRCYRIIENEVALDYCPLRAVQSAVALQGRVQYTAFSHTPVNILDVKDSGGERLRFTVYASYLEVPDASGMLTVEYSYAPPAAELDDSVAFPARISARLLAAGVCAEFLLTAGRYAEAEVWEGKFRDALRAAGVFRKKLCAPRARRWA